MDQRGALNETVIMAERHGMPELPGSDLGLAHLRDMRSRVTPSFSDAKVGRWLGWAQCALVASNVGVTLDDVKRLNLSYAD